MTVMKNDVMAAARDETTGLSLRAKEGSGLPKKWSSWVAEEGEANTNGGRVEVSDGEGKESGEEGAGEDSRTTKRERKRIGVGGFEERGMRKGMEREESEEIRGEGFVFIF
ncbi:uncharacterized protein DS421_20g702590 [Arachis hypogaea]|nr:uncharacterized protein DS421_20g702590 [Arachis hypogaea]